MSKITSHYGEWLGGFDWSHMITIRLHFRLSEVSAYNLCKRLFKGSRHINKLFYSVEKDRQDDMNHMHLLVDSKWTTLRRDQLASAAGFKDYPNAISFIENVKSKEAVSLYATKYLDKKGVFYDMLYDRHSI